MKYNLLGKTGVLVSELCLGAMTFGGKGFWEAIGRLPEDEVTRLVKIALERAEGIPLISLLLIRERPSI